MSENRKRYDKAFKVETVRLVADLGRSVAVVAEEIGIHPNTIHKWVRQYKAAGDQAFPGAGHMKPEEEDARRLRRWNAELEEEVAILKKPWPSSQGPPGEIRVHQEPSLRVWGGEDVPGARRCPERFLLVAQEA